MVAAPPPGGGPGTFNAVEPGTSYTNGPIYTKIAGKPIRLTVKELTGSNAQKQFKLWLLKPDANGTLCGGGWSRVTSLTEDGWAASDGWVSYHKKSVTANFDAYPNAWAKARIGIAAHKGKGNGNGNNATHSCSTDVFAIRPAYFQVVGHDESRTQPGDERLLDATNATATPVHNAGQPFTLTATPMNAGGRPIISGYGGSRANPIVDEYLTTLGAHPGQLTVPTWTVSDERAVALAKYSETGVIDVQVTDAGFAIIDANDGSPLCQRTVGRQCVNGTSSYWTDGAKIGRFVPDHFSVSLNTPEFATGCRDGRFTYIGKAFKFATGSEPIITVTAQNAQNAPTMNYTGSLFRLQNDPDSVSGRRYVDNGAPDDAPLETSGLPPIFPKPMTAADPVIADLGNGQATLTFSTGAGLDYKHEKPVAPFESKIDLGINVKDLDGVTVKTVDGAPGTNPVTFKAIAFDNGNEMRYGRVFVNSAVGSELLDLPMEMLAQYYQGANTGFVTNTDDSCTTGASASLDNYQPYPGNTLPSSSGDPEVVFKKSGAAAGGDFGLSLSAPGPGAQGTVDVMADVPAWLQFDWDGDGTYDDNPSARATFGVYKGNPHRIYQHEIIGPN